MSGTAPIHSIVLRRATWVRFRYAESNWRQITGSWLTYRTSRKLVLPPPSGGLLATSDKTQRALLRAHPRATTLGRGCQARRLVGFDVNLAVEHTAAELQELGTDSLAAPALQGGLADAPARGQLFLVEVSDFHLGLLPNELAGVHDGAVRRRSQRPPNHRTWVRLQTRESNWAANQTG